VDRRPDNRQGDGQILEKFRTGIPNFLRRIETLLSGYKFRLTDRRNGEFPFGDALRSGQTKELGDVRMKRPQE
jgi:hypothetical protein